MLSAAAVALLGLLPFLVVSPGELLSQTFGFAFEQHLQHLPFPLAPHTTDPNKVLERTFPALLVVFTVLWAAVVLPRGRGGALVPMMVVGLVYLLARTDEFHLVPLAAVLAIALAAAAAREGRMVLKVALGAGLALIVVHGLDRQLGKLTDATRLAGIDLPTVGGVRTGPDDAQALGELAVAVRQRSKPGDPLLSAPPRYDRVRVGDTLVVHAAQPHEPDALRRRRNPAS